MIDSASSPVSAAPPSDRPRAVFRMIQSDRMAGSVPAWVPPESAQAVALNRLETAGGARAGGRSFDDVLNDALASYSAQGPENLTPDEEPFGFGDVIDIVNPLQHLPLVGTVYRSLTGDEIRPASQIIGGAVFGGVVGAASGLVNAVIREETGKDIAGNVVALLSPKDEGSAPEQQLAAASETIENPLPTAALPGTALSFADLGHRPAPETPRQVWKFND